MGVYRKEWGRCARMRHYSPTPDGGKNYAAAGKPARRACEQHQATALTLLLMPLLYYRFGQPDTLRAHDGIAPVEGATA